MFEYKFLKNIDKYKNMSKVLNLSNVLRFIYYWDFNMFDHNIKSKIESNLRYYDNFYSKHLYGWKLYQNLNFQRILQYNLKIGVWLSWDQQHYLFIKPINVRQLINENIKNKNKNKTKNTENKNENKNWMNDFHIENIFKQIMKSKQNDPNICQYIKKCDKDDQSGDYFLYPLCIVIKCNPNGSWICIDNINRIKPFIYCVSDWLWMIDTSTNCCKILFSNVTEHKEIQRFFNTYWNQI